MKQVSLFALLGIAMLSLMACNDAKYPIDEKPSVKIDSRLLGTWIAIEKKKPRVSSDADMEFTMSKQDELHYLISIDEKGMHKPEKQTTNAFLSKINTVEFLNISDNAKSRGTTDTSGYIFLKVLGVNAKAGTLTLVNIADTTMNLLTSSAQVRERITKNLDNPSFYKDTIEFHRIRSTRK